MINAKRSGTVLVLGACALLGACGTKNEGNAGDTTAANATADTGAMAGGASTSGAAGGEVTGAGASASAAGSAALTDPNIVSMIGLINGSEIAAGKIAQTKATNASVRSFARDMVQQHTAMQKQGDQLATKNNVTPQPPPDANMLRAHADSESTALNGAAKGSTFDRAYIDAQVNDHQMALDNLQRFQTSAQNADLKNLIQQAIPKVQQHLDRAKQIQTNLGSTT